jgi:TolA-binding protein
MIAKRGIFIQNWASCILGRNFGIRVMFFIHVLCSFLIVKLFLPAFMAGENHVVLQTDQELHAILALQSKGDEDKKQLADEYFDATLFKQAIPFYRAAWDREGDQYAESLPSGEENVLQKLVFCYYMEGKFSEIIKLLENQSVQDPFLTYMLGSSYRHSDDYENAKTWLQKFLDFQPKGQGPSAEDARFDLGLTYFLEGNYAGAESHFLTLLTAKNAALKNASRLNLARIALAKQDYPRVEALLSYFDADLEVERALQLEASYLRGKLAFSLKDYFQAARHFESALPAKKRHLMNWYQDTLYHLGWCYLKIGNESAQNLIFCQQSLEKAEILFQQLSEVCKEEQVYLSIGLCHLIKASLLKDATAYQRAEEVLSRKELFSPLEGQIRALRLRAEMAPTFRLREKFYRELTSDAYQENPFFAKGWYLRAENSLEQAAVLVKEGHSAEANGLFQQAASEFAQAFELLKALDKRQAADAIRNHLQACYFQNQKEIRLGALDTLDKLIHHHRDILEAFDHPDEVFYLKALIAMQIALLDGDTAYKDLAIRTLLSQFRGFPHGTYADKAHYLLAWIYYEDQDLQRAKDEFLLLAQACDRSSLAGSALFFAAACSDQLGEDSQIGKKYRLQVLDKYPNSSHAAEAYFTLYTYREYLQGDKLAVKHLQGFCEKYPTSPLLLNAYFLIGLDHKRDRKTDDGKWIRKKNLKSAIDAFQEIETHFNEFQEQKKFSIEEFKHYLLLYYKAKLEKAFANLRIAESSQGAKKTIYIEYAANVFKELIQEIEEKQHLSILAPGDPFPLLQEEAYLGLAQAYIKGEQDFLANQQLTRMLEKYRATKITRGYFLSRVWYEKGCLAQKHAQTKEALSYFKLAEDAGKGKVLSSEQKLSLWIEQSMCYRQLNQLDDAMLLLSKVINSDVASGLRLKAMFLRSEMYELQGRQELAKKQLETIVKKGGDWSSKAKEKLEKEYGLD